MPTDLRTRLQRLRVQKVKRELPPSVPTEVVTQRREQTLAAGRKRMDENRQVREVAHLERLKLHLNLTDDQVAKLKAGNATLRSQAKAIHENDNLLPQEKMEQMKALMAKRNETYKAILTPEQYAQFEKMMSRRRAGGGAVQGLQAGSAGGEVRTRTSSARPG